MPPKAFLGEFEQMVLLAILQGGKSANALEIRRELEASANRRVTTSLSFSDKTRKSSSRICVRSIAGVGVLIFLRLKLIETERDVRDSCHRCQIPS